MGNREDTALAGTLIERDDVEVRPERLPAKITDPSIDVYRDGSVDDGHTSLACDSCLEWYHLACLEVSAKGKDLDLWELPHSCSYVGCDSCAFIALLKQLE